MSTPDIRIRIARAGEASALEALIARSARELSRGDYDDAQLDVAIGTVFGVDSTLIADGTYFVAEIEGDLAGCGGWSFRRTLFGADAGRERDAARLDPATDAAKIRAFFVHPDFARRGVGTAILNACEQAARAAGFRAAEMMATVPGERLYAAFGYAPSPAIDYDLGQGQTIRFIPMRKALE